ncbi:MAG: PilZ domain-containing protein [Deltaproteobacteria bacterium]|nr:PilZ domain-containing protein [Deltaproteobacteria bacterium]
MLVLIIVARQATTLSTVLASLRATLASRLASTPGSPDFVSERRRGRRVPVDHEGKLFFGDLVLPGRIGNVGQSGVLFRTGVLVEVGEPGQLFVAGFDAPGIPVHVAWASRSTRNGTPTPLAGLGLAFDVTTAQAERHALEALLFVLEAANKSAT